MDVSGIADSLLALRDEVSKSAPTLATALSSPLQSNVVSLLGLYLLHNPAADIPALASAAAEENAPALLEKAEAYWSVHQPQLPAPQVEPPPAPAPAAPAAANPPVTPPAAPAAVDPPAPPPVGPDAANPPEPPPGAPNVVVPPAAPDTTALFADAASARRHKQGDDQNIVAKRLAYGVTIGFFILVFLLIVLDRWPLATALAQSPAGGQTQSTSGSPASSPGKVTSDAQTQPGTPEPQTGAPQYQDILFTLMGVIGTGWAGIISFYFGSSVGSRQQSQTLQDISSKVTTPPPKTTPG